MAECFWLVSSVAVINTTQILNLLHKCNSEVIKKNQKCVLFSIAVLFMIILSQLQHKKPSHLNQHVVLLSGILRIAISNTQYDPGDIIFLHS